MGVGRKGTVGDVLRRLVKRKRNGISEFGGNMLREEVSQHRVVVFFCGGGRERDSCAQIHRSLRLVLRREAESLGE